MPPTTQVHIIPTPAQQRLLDQIQAQRQRLVVLGSQRQHRPRTMVGQRLTPLGTQQGSFPVGVRIGTFAREHPLAIVAAVGAVWAIGPRRLIRWADAVLPLLIKLRAY